MARLSEIQLIGKIRRHVSGQKPHRQSLLDTAVQTAASPLLRLVLQ
jgi:hypothetical protein